jgi:hypothetical protein
MPIYEMKSERLERLIETSFKKAGIKERTDLQRLLRHQIEVISPDTLVIAEEFGEWEDSRRRIDLLGLDKEANLVVIEIKRTEDGGHMELQAIRYAAMVSTLTFGKVIEIFEKHLKKLGKGDDARESILDFLGWDEDEIDEDEFAQETRIILASAEFSKELTTAVMWLNDQGIDIRCIRLKPYDDDGKLLLAVEQIIPLQEAEQYQIKVREKILRERIAREQSKDFTKYDITIEGITDYRMNKRKAIFKVVFHLCSSGIDPEQIRDVIPKRKNRLFESADGTLNAEQFIDALSKRRALEGRKFEPRRYFCMMDEYLINWNGKTYAFSNQWGHSTEESLKLLIDKFSDKGVQYKTSE